MAHGMHCNCMMCTVGKKLGMIRKDEHQNQDSSNRNVCKKCGHIHKENSLCDCGCK